MAEELYINDQLIDLPSNTVSQTKQINDIGDVEDRQANYSNSIKIPRTSNNIAAFKMLGISGNTTRLPYENVSVKYIVDGLELITNGKGVIKNTNGFYNLVVYDGVISLSELLGNKELNSLDFSAYDHELTVPLFINSFTNTSGYIYAIGRFHAGSPTPPLPFNINLQNSSFFLHTLFEMIFTQKGYSIEGDIFTDANYLKRLISMDTGYDRSITSDIITFYERDNSSDPEITDTYPLGSPTTTNYIIDTFTAGAEESYNFVMSGSISRTFGSDAKIIIEENGIPKYTSGVITSTVNIDESLALLAGATVDIIMQMSSVEDGGFQKIQFETNYLTSVFITNSYIDIKIADLIGDTRQIDFVKDIMQRYGLIFTKVKNENIFKFMRMEDLFSDTANAEDWSSKYSDFSNEEYKSNYAQDNIFKFSYDESSTEDDPNFADGEFYVNDINLDEEKTHLTSIFKATYLDPFTSLPVMNHWVDEEVDEVIEIVPQKDGIRIFEFEYVTRTISTGGTVFTGEVPQLDFEPVKYQNELDNNYPKFNLMLNDYKKISLMINLNILDVYSVDFLRLKYFNQLGKYYYLNKISNFKKGKLTKCEFVQVV